MRELRVPVYADGGWKAGDKRAIPTSLESLFTEHSGRNMVPSVAVYVEDDKSKRDCLGRWRPTGSDDYTRTYRSVVTQIQLKVASTLRSGG